MPPRPNPHPRTCSVAPVRVMIWLVATLVAVLGAAAARAQQAAAGAGTGEVDISVNQFGVGGEPRAGSWFGINIAAKDNGAEPRGVLLQLALRDADGDQLLARSYVVLNPGQRQSVWLYSWLPYDGGGSQTYLISAYEARETRREGSSGLRYTEERLLGQFFFQPGQGVIAPSAGMLGVIGRQIDVHLQGFEPTDNSDALLAGHEITRIVDSLTPADMPDRWMGLDPFSTLIWADSTSQGSPANLMQEQADAIREWVHRGGHLIVVLPQAGQAWIDYPSNLLTDMMPRVTLETEVGVDLSDYWPLFMRGGHRTELEELELTAGQQPWWFGHQVHFLRPRGDAGYGEARCLLAGPESEGAGEAEGGRCVVAQRLHGRGAVTLVGIDITAGRFRTNVTGVPTAIESDVWWNRILGRRWELIAQYEKDEFLNVNKGFFSGMRESAWVDDAIQRSINQTGKAAAGLLMAFIVFAAYWVLAGPVAYFALKQQRMKQHSWLAFVLVGAVFTGVAWGGANLLRPRRVEGKHITILEHVYGQPVQAARSWTSVLLPDYGETRIAIENTTVGGLEVTNAITPWKPAPEMGASSRSSFPDARKYVVDALSPNEMSVPTRATVKQFQVDWAGFLDLNMPTPLVPEGASPALGEEITAAWDEDPGPGMDISVNGTIQHQLPDALTDVTIILVEGQVDSTLPGRPFVEAWAVRRPQPWAPGEPLALGPLFEQPAGVGPRPKDDRNALEYLNGIRASDDAAIALFPLLRPPEGSAAARLGRSNDDNVFRRQATHGWDVARWFTQPCLIVMGRLEGELPIPLEVGSAGAEATQNRIDEGRTYLRWIYPLPPRPPSIGGSPAEGEQPEEGP